MDKKNLILSIVFLLVSLYFLLNIITKDSKPFYLSGFIITALVGLAFLRNYKNRRR